MLKTVIVGASGYTGAELTRMVFHHPELDLVGLYVSANSEDANKPISSVHGFLKGWMDLPLQPLESVAEVAKQADVVLLATAHQVSHQLAPQFLEQGCTVFDLSGAYRIKSACFYRTFYDFEHQHLNWLEQAVYGLPEWNANAIKTASLIAVPGCYPTAAQLALKPLLQKGLIDLSQWPVINAVSGVSGAGRHATLNNSFCEVSLQAYGVFTHRHQPEIAAHLGCDVIFIPHIGNFKRGILATITAKLAIDVSSQAVCDAFATSYQNAPLVRPLGEGQNAKLQSVQNTGFCDIGWAVSKEHVVITCAIDNLLKGAASQAIQCINIRFGFSPLTAIL